MERVETYLRKLILASVGAADLGAEKLGALIDECAARGEITVDKGRALNEELKRTVSDAVKPAKAEKVNVAALTPEERKALLAELQALEAEEA